MESKRVSRVYTFSNVLNASGPVDSVLLSWSVSDAATGMILGGFSVDASSDC